MEVTSTEQYIPKARWTVIQPWRGLFGVVVPLGVAFVVTPSFDMDKGSEAPFAKSQEFLRLP
jgi:hypothetical protein